MEWTADVSAGDWLRERIDDPWSGTMHDVVPRGFPAYARIFHPGHTTDADDVTRTVTWAQTAAAFGTEFHAGAQWGRLVRTPSDANAWQQVAAPDGRVFDAPAEGALESDLVAVVAGILASHTSTPDAGYVALWEGDGALLGHLGDGPSRVFFQIGDPEDPALSHHNEMLAHAVKDPFNNVFRKPTWQEGILSREISEGPRLELPGRGHVLFRGGVAELADPDWVLRVPWRDRPAEAHGFDSAAQSPSLIWPDDRAWVLVTEVDHDSTIVGGSSELIGALVTDERLEALPVSEGAELTWDSDEVNR